MMPRDLIGLIPAAGRGLRLSLPYPKELYPIIRNNRFKPIAQYVVENLTMSGVKDIVFVIDETKHQLLGYFGDGTRFGCRFSYVVQEHHGDSNSSSSPGLAHALACAHHLVAGKTVCFGMADTIMKPTNVYKCLLDAAHAEDQVLLGLFDVTRPEKFGMVDMDRQGRVRQIIDKPAQTRLRQAWGCIVWDPAFSEHLYESVKDKGVADFARIMNEAIDKGMHFRGLALNKGEYSDLGTYEEIIELERKYGG